MRETLEQILAGQSLTAEQARLTLEQMADTDTDPVLTGAVLAALRAKGETGEELAGFARGLRERATRPAGSGYGDAVDVVGTGGDGSQSLNLSTGAALLAAACGQPVIKHGNRSVSSRSGSADVLRALGVELPLPGQEKALFDETGFTFLFAPFYHPAMKSVAPVRRSLGVRTIFNLVGPLANPAQPRHMLVGVGSLDAARVVAEALVGLGIDRAYVVHGAEGWDEPTPAGPYHLIEVGRGELSERTEDPLELGIPRSVPDDLKGGDATYNAEQLLRVFDGESGAHRNALVLQASLALRVAGLESDPLAAIGQAEAAIDAGRASRIVERLQILSGRKHVAVR